MALSPVVFTKITHDHFLISKFLSQCQPLYCQKPKDKKKHLVLSQLANKFIFILTKFTVVTYYQKKLPISTQRWVVNAEHDTYATEWEKKS